MRKLLALTLAAILAIIPASTLATNADGAASLASCNFANNRSGGVEFFSLDNQTGGSRVWCVTVQDTDTNFGGFPSGTPDSNTGDVGSFNDKTDSIRLRVNPGCAILILLYYPTGASGSSDDGWYKINNGSTVATYDLNTANNVISSATIEAFDAGGPRCEGMYI